MNKDQHGSRMEAGEASIVSLSWASHLSNASARSDYHDKTFKDVLSDNKSQSKSRLDLKRIKEEGRQESRGEGWQEGGQNKSI